MSDTSQGDGWWIASDGKWYAPERHPDVQESSATVSGSEEIGQGHFGDGVTRPLYEFHASRFKGGRMFSPNVIRVWSDRIEEYEHHAVRKKGTQAINYHQVAQVRLGRGLRWSDISVESAGGHMITLRGVPKADGERVKALIEGAVNDARNGTIRSTRAEPAASSETASNNPISVADELVKLGGLVSQGLLTQEEFDAEKARLLSR